MRTLLADSPPWLSKQLDNYCKDPDRFGKPTSAAVAAKAFDSPERWREVMPLLEEKTGIRTLFSEGRLD